MNIFNKIAKFNRKLYIYYRRVVTNTYYKSLLVELGSKVIIESPLLMTCEHIKIGNGVYLWPNLRIEGVSDYLEQKFNPSIEIGNDVSIQQNLHLTCAGQVIIKKGTAIAANVTITDIIHPYLDIDTPPSKQYLEISNVTIGELCNIYNNSIILPGVTLGRNSIVSANSVVMSGVYPDYAVLAGAPAKIVKRYCVETRRWKKTNFDGTFLTQEDV
ncbi:acyltransferase [Pedobacter sp. FW305-3-2-15-E-R2A2]|uniref:acyltransferase n=1 Tax=Pedobacter sp. FW305-3-2-15-E-R2A2 TaxID=3140251 RepID=UPI0031404E64